MPRTEEERTCVTRPCTLIDYVQNACTRVPVRVRMRVRLVVRRVRLRRVGCCSGRFVSLGS